MCSDAKITCCISLLSQEKNSVMIHGNGGSNFKHSCNNKKYKIQMTTKAAMDVRKGHLHTVDGNQSRVSLKKRELKLPYNKRHHS